MPHEVIMPALGMAQDTGLLVAWHKAPGDPVAAGDVLFEVETDKATMEVEAQGDGFLTDVRAAEGDDVPVGQVIALISRTATPAAPETPAETPPGEAPPQDTAPQEAAPKQTAGPAPGDRQVIMPALGMAQDTGLIVAWHKAPGDPVAAGDILFEVETDKATMEVPAEAGGYIAAIHAGAGDEVPVGEVIALLSAGKPEAPPPAARRDAARNPARESQAAPGPEPRAGTGAAPGPEPRAGARAASAPAGAAGRILASPKARRLARDRGLDLARLVEAGVPQPFHAADIETLAGLPVSGPVSGPPYRGETRSETRADGTAWAAAGSATDGAVGGAVGRAVAGRHLTAEADPGALAVYLDWAAGAGLTDPGAILAGFAAASLPASLPAGHAASAQGHATSAQDHATVAVEIHGRRRCYRVPGGRRLGAVAPAETGAAPDLLLRDLRGSRVRAVALGPEAVPVLTIAERDGRLEITLECAGDRLSAGDAIALIADFSGRLDEPLRHLM